MVQSRVGYPVDNITLSKKGIRITRDCKLNEKSPEEVIKQAKELARLNLLDLVEILKWNIANNIKLFRIANSIFPHIGNWKLLKKSDMMDETKLAYSLEEFEDYIKKVSEICLKFNIRVTFHCSPYVVLSTKSKFVLKASQRELYWQTKFFDIGGFPPNSTVTLHGGGLYGSKVESKERFIQNFNNLPINSKRRIILENDEDCYNINDIFEISYSIKSYEGFEKEKRFCIPVCFDYFHYLCYNKNYQVNPKIYQKQISLKKVQELLKKQKKEICNFNIKSDFNIKSFESCQMKMHISEQNPLLRIGAHSDFISEIPQWMLDIGIDLMLESKKKEETYFILKKKYNF